MLSGQPVDLAPTLMCSDVSLFPDADHRVFLRDFQESNQPSDKVRSFLRHLYLYLAKFSSWWKM
jgi:hypothetical protein